MIQRIQSIWLLLATVVTLCLLFVPIVGFTGTEGYFTLDAFGLKSSAGNSGNNYPLLISTLATALISLFNIFNFRNRKLQIRIATLNILLVLGIALWFYLLGKSVTGMKELDIEFGVFLFPLAIIFLLLAIRGIKKDEKLIRSADRLR